jgi:signal recognition particle subunit SEC65
MDGEFASKEENEKRSPKLKWEGTFTVKQDPSLTLSKNKDMQKIAN